MVKRVAVIGTLNTKRAELGLIRQCLRKQGLESLLIDISCLEYTQSSHEANYAQADVALKAGLDLNEIFGLPLFKAAPRMSGGAYQILCELIAEKKIHGCLGIGGANGTLMAAAVMENLPLGFPKAIISVMAAVDTRRLVSHTDIVMFNAIGDAVLNPVLEVIIDNAAAALKGMTAAANLPVLPEMVGLTVLGVTDRCVSHCRAILDDKGYPSLLLHSNGPGGATLEKMVARDFFWGVLDITVNELVNNLLGGVFDAGPDRLEAALAKQLPLVISSGAADFVNFWGTQIPEQYRNRLFLRHNTQNTLMRTNVAENVMLGRCMAEKLNRAAAPVKVLIPAQGFSKYDHQDGPKGSGLDGRVIGTWHWPEADQALAAALRDGLRNPLVQVEVKEMHINEAVFARELVNSLLAMHEK
ncbi:MAG: Tm-1-like ATP-binding domain-containing protein [Bacillota bacterium]